MRKAQRQRGEAWALDVFDHAPYVTVSFVDDEGQPYGVPLSVVRADEHTFYFHCADEGKKIDCMRACRHVWLSAVSKCMPVYEEEKNNFTEHYRSAMASGVVNQVAGREEKIAALRLLCRRFLPRAMDHFDDAVARSLDRTAVYRITLTEPAVGKEKG